MFKTAQQVNDKITKPAPFPINALGTLNVLFWNVMIIVVRVTKVKPKTKNDLRDPFISFNPDLVAGTNLRILVQETSVA